MASSLTPKTPLDALPANTESMAASSTANFPLENKPDDHHRHKRLKLESDVDSQAFGSLTHFPHKDRSSSSTAGNLMQPPSGPSTTKGHPVGHYLSSSPTQLVHRVTTPSHTSTANYGRLSHPNSIASAHPAYLNSNVHTPPDRYVHCFLLLLQVVNHRRHHRAPIQSHRITTIAMVWATTCITIITINTHPSHGQPILISRIITRWKWMVFEPITTILHSNSHWFYLIIPHRHRPCIAHKRPINTKWDDVKAICRPWARLQRICPLLMVESARANPSPFDVLLRCFRWFVHWFIILNDFYPFLAVDNSDWMRTFVSIVLDSPFLVYFLKSGHCFLVLPFLNVYIEWQQPTRCPPRAHSLLLLQTLCI